MELTKEETIKALESCNTDRCEFCPLNNNPDCCELIKKSAMRYLKEKEPAPSANDTSSEVKTLHLDDSILLDICQEGMLKISDRIAECADGDDYILGYVHAILDVVEQLRGGYRMSHEERRLLAGTHELFKKKEEK